MSNVKNKKMINQIALKSLKARKKRNLIAILAIVLTSVLFTALFTIGGSLIEKNQESTMRQVGGSAHAGYKYLTKSEYEKVAKDKGLKSVSYRIALADAENKPLIKVRTEMAYYEELEAKWSFCYPEEGHMPKKENECVASDLTLKALGVPCKIGEKFSVDFSVRGKKYSKEFILCGWYKGDRVSMSQVMCVSKKLVNQLAPTAESYQYGGDIAGSYMVDFNFKTSFNLKKQLEELNKRIGFEEKSTGVNWAYLGMKADAETVVLIVVMLGIILISGYLIIYNIFYINVFGDIRFYGLLKTIGTTKKQLGKIVRKQANLLSLAGIPIGLILGAVVGAGLLPIICANLSMGDTEGTNVVLHPWIFIGSAVFSFLTVQISCIKPCRIVAKISPIEAVKLTESSVNAKVKGKKRRTHKLTMHAFGLANIKRNRKKAVLVVFSLSLSLILLNTVYTLLKGFDMDKYVSNRSVSDYMVTDATTDNPALSERTEDGVTSDFLTELREQDGIKESGNVYYSEWEQKLSDWEKERLEERIWKDWKKNFAYMIQLIGEEDMKQEIDADKERGSITAKMYGLDQLVFEKLKCEQGELDWEKFKSGNYIVVNQFESDDGEKPIYDVGDKITLTGENGFTKEYEVMALVSMPNPAEFQMYFSLEINYILPSSEFLNYFEGRQPMKTLFNISAKDEKQIESWLENYCTNINDDLTYTSKSTMEAEFATLQNMIVIVGGFLSFVLALIGILNFVNTILTGILSRKQEFAMLESVGMTRKQLREMLMWEGGYYALFTSIVAVLAGSILSMTLIKSYTSGFFFLTWKFTVLPILICIPFLLLIVLFVPYLACEKMCRISVVERIRSGE